MRYKRTGDASSSSLALTIPRMQHGSPGVTDLAWLWYSIKNRGAAKRTCFPMVCSKMSTGSYLIRRRTGRNVHRLCFLNGRIEVFYPGRRESSVAMLILSMSDLRILGIRFATVRSAQALPDGRLRPPCARPADAGNASGSVAGVATDTRQRALWLR